MPHQHYAHYMTSRHRSRDVMGSLFWSSWACLFRPPGEDPQSSHQPSAAAPPSRQAQPSPAKKAAGGRDVVLPSRSHKPAFAVEVSYGWRARRAIRRGDYQPRTPGDGTPGCSREAGGGRQRWQQVTRPRLRVYRRNRKITSRETSKSEGGMCACRGIEKRGEARRRKP